MKSGRSGAPAAKRHPRALPPTVQPGRSGANAAKRPPAAKQRARTTPSAGTSGAPAAKRPPRAVLPTIENRQRKVRVSQKGLQKLLVQLLAVTGNPGKTVHLTLLTDAGMLELNRQTFGKNRTTNVISFPLGGVPGDAAQLLGDVVVSVETARSEAEKAGLPFETRLVQLIIHGFLHILGYEHVNVGVAERRRMQRAEAKVYAQVAEWVPGTLL